MGRALSLRALGWLTALLVAAPAALGAGHPAAPGPFAREGVQAPGPPTVEGDPLTVYLVTAGPGDAIWERFGHNGIWIHDARTGEDIFWEWGLFSFSQTGFIPRLARGTMLYSMAGRPLDQVVATYRRADRALWAQELALTPDQEVALDRLVRVNARPENRDYVYHYYLDNCSTRARDALDRVLGGTLEARFSGIDTGVTWRWHTRRLLRDDPLADTGIQIVLGRPGDRTVTAWEEMFLPARLRSYLNEAEVTTPQGPRPLVVREFRILESARGPEPQAPASRVVPGLALGLLLAGGMALLVRAASAEAGWALRAFAVAGTVWSGVAGLVGTVLLLAWFFTDHDFWRWNENLLVLNPLLLVLPFLLLPALLGRRPGPGLPALAGLVAAGGVLDAAWKLLPGLQQGNGEVLALALPIHLVLLWGALRLQRQ